MPVGAVVCRRCWFPANPPRTRVRDLLIIVVFLPYPLPRASPVFPRWLASRAYYWSEGAACLRNRRLQGQAEWPNTEPE